MSWRDEGNCAGWGERWHELGKAELGAGHGPDAQKRVCWDGCPVMAECWDGCVSSYETWTFGVWAGTKESERRAMAFFGFDMPKHPGRAAAPPEGRAAVDCGGL